MLFVGPELERAVAVQHDEELFFRGVHVRRPREHAGVAHAFRGGVNGLTLLAWGTREPNDICWYPRSNKIYWRGVGVMGRIEQLDYFDGEPVEDV